MSTKKAPSKERVSVDWEAQAQNNPAVGGAVVLGVVVRDQNLASPAALVTWLPVAESTIRGIPRVGMLPSAQRSDEPTPPPSTAASCSSVTA